MKILQFMVLQTTFWNILFFMNMDNVYGVEMLRKYYKDRDNLKRPYVLANGTVVIVCHCASDVSILYDDRIEVAFSTCTNGLAYVHLDVSNMALGKYRCKQGMEISNEIFMLQFKLCDPTSAKCRVRCPGKKPQFCVVTPKNPEGRSCTSPLMTGYNSVLDPFFPERYCPGDSYRFAEAVSNGFDKVLATSTAMCPHPDDMYYFEIDGQKLHYMQAIHLKNLDSVIKIVCPSKGRFTEVELRYACQSRGRKLDFREKRNFTNGCFGESRLSQITDDIKSLSPLRVQFSAHFGPFEQDYNTMSYFVVFSDKFRYSLVNKTGVGVIGVQVYTPPNLDPEFVTEITGVLTHKSRTIFNLTANTSNVLNVSTSGNLSITINHTYRSCDPHTFIQGPVMKLQLDIVNNLKLPEAIGSKIDYTPWIAAGASGFALICGFLLCLMTRSTQTKKRSRTGTKSIKADEKMKSVRKIGGAGSIRKDRRTKPGRNDPRTVSAMKRSTMTSVRKDRKITPVREDSRMTSNMKLSKMRSNKKDRKTTPVREDSKMTSDMKASRLRSAKTDSRMTSVKKDRKTTPAQEYPRMISDMTGSRMRSTKKDSKMTSVSKDRKATPERFDSKMTSDMRASKVRSTKKDRKTTPKRPDPRMTSDMKGSWMRSTKKDSRMTSIKKDRKTTPVKEDKKSKHVKRDPRTTSVVKHSKMTSVKQDPRMKAHHRPNGTPSKHVPQQSPKAANRLHKAKPSPKRK